MKTRSSRKRGLYVSYSEEKNGLFDEAVQISNRSGGLIWLDKSRRRPESLHYPTDIFVRLSGQERYFRGTLVDIRLADGLNRDFALEEQAHRPSRWRDRDVKACPRPNKDFRSVFFIHALHEVPSPPEVANIKPPQSPVYVNL
jgi:hypothetical protein